MTLILTLTLILALVLALILILTLALTLTLILLLLLSADVDLGVFDGNVGIEAGIDMVDIHVIDHQVVVLIAVVQHCASPETPRGLPVISKQYADGVDMVDFVAARAEPLLGQPGRTRTRGFAASPPFPMSAPGRTQNVMPPAVQIFGHKIAAFLAASECSH
ncbi:MAG: hypothetical protein ACK4HF_08380 [Paracoccaceae bacterium]